MTSLTIASGFVVRAASSSSIPSVAVTTRNPSDATWNDVTFSWIGSSSTTITSGASGRSEAATRAGGSAGTRPPTRADHTARRGVGGGGGGHEGGGQRAHALHEPRRLDGLHEDLVEQLGAVTC